MSIVFALPRLFDLVEARFAGDLTTAEQTFGWRTPQRHKASSARIAWVPGDPSGGVGPMLPARNPGGDPRSLATLGELFTVYISATDATAPEDERKQYEATRALYDAWYRAVYLAARGTFEVQSLDWNVSKNERRHGAELVCVCAIEAKIPDAPYTLAPVDTTADITTSVEDLDELTAAAPTP